MASFQLAAGELRTDQLKMLVLVAAFVFVKFVTSCQHLQLQLSHEMRDGWCTENIPPHSIYDTMVVKEWMRSGSWKIISSPPPISLFLLLLCAMHYDTSSIIMKINDGQWSMMSVWEGTKKHIMNRRWCVWHHNIVPILAIYPTISLWPVSLILLSFGLQNKMFYRGGRIFWKFRLAFVRRCAMMCMSISICHHNHCSLLQPIIMKPNPNQLLLFQDARDLIIIVHFIDHATCGYIVQEQFEHDDERNWRRFLQLKPKPSLLLTTAGEYYAQWALVFSTTPSISMLCENARRNRACSWFRLARDKHWSFHPEPQDLESPNRRQLGHVEIKIREIQRRWRGRLHISCMLSAEPWTLSLVVVSSFSTAWFARRCNRGSRRWHATLAHFNQALDEDWNGTSTIATFINEILRALLHPDPTRLSWCRRRRRQQWYEGTVGDFVPRLMFSFIFHWVVQFICRAAALYYISNPNSPDDLHVCCSYCKLKLYSSFDLCHKWWSKF